MTDDRLFQTPDAFRPVLRFAVCSDLHIKADGDDHVQRLRTMMRTVNALAKGDPLHPTVDAVLFAGDIANRGTKAQFDAFWHTVQQEKDRATQILCVLAKNHDNWERGKGAKKTGLRHYEDLSGQTPDFHVCIAGFHFIGLSTCRCRGRYYMHRQRRWLAAALRRAVRDAPDRPVFVFQHEHIRDTVFGSSSFDGWGNAFFKNVLSRYPQVVHFSGHSHYPLNDPRSIFQGDFTAVGTGAMSYAELTVDDRRCVHPPQCETIAQGWVVEADTQNRLCLSGYDFLSDELLCRYVLDSFGDPQAFMFRPAQQRARAEAPAFDADAALSLQKTGESLTVTVPAAVSADCFPVVLYRIKALDRDGQTVEETVAVPPYWKAPTDEPVAAALKIHPSVCSVTVWAENAFGMASAPITKEASFDV